MRTRQSFEATWTRLEALRARGMDTLAVQQDTGMCCCLALLLAASHSYGSPHALLCAPGVSGINCPGPLTDISAIAYPELFPQDFMHDYVEGAFSMLLQRVTAAWVGPGAPLSYAVINDRLQLARPLWRSKTVDIPALQAELYLTGMPPRERTACPMHLTEARDDIA
jgi:hypothetical protein